MESLANDCKLKRSIWSEGGWGRSGHYQQVNWKWFGFSFRFFLSSLVCGYAMAVVAICLSVNDHHNDTSWTQFIPLVYGAFTQKLLDSRVYSAWFCVVVVVPFDIDLRFFCSFVRGVVVAIWFLSRLSSERGSIYCVWMMIFFSFASFTTATVHHSLLLLLLFWFNASNYLSTCVFVSISQIRHFSPLLFGVQ